MKLLLEHAHVEGIRYYDTYRKHGGYRSVEKALKMTPDEIVEEVKKSIAQLPDGYRTILSLYLLEGYDHDEIASILHITSSTSRSQFNRAKNKLREILKERTWQTI